MQICKSSECTGCFACFNKCPKGCISMKENTIGHIYPDINEDICINCGACVQVCPTNNQVIFKAPLNTYAAYSLDKEERKTSSSGGVAAEFSKAIIGNGGVVYGCSSLLEKEIQHIRVDQKEDLTLLKGSKYVQSYINNTYQLIKKDLLAGKKVLFIGTPCQVAGLKSFLGADYPLLIAVDIICHGVPSQRLLKEHLNEHAMPPFKVVFRGENGHELNVFDVSSNKKLYSKAYTCDLYFTGFSKNLFFRDSCYSCQYAKSERCSDLTIGDFWGLGKDESFLGDNSNGVSVVIVNTEKGNDFLNGLSDALYLERRTLNEAINGNPQLKHPSKAHSKSAQFKYDYEQKGFRKAIKKNLHKEIFKYRILYFINKSPLLTKLLAKVLH